MRLLSSFNSLNKSAFICNSLYYIVAVDYKNCISFQEKPNESVYSSAYFLVIAVFHQLKRYNKKIEKLKGLLR